MSQVTEENYKQFEELIDSISIGAASIKEASADGKVNWKDMPNLIPMAMSAVKGLDGIEKVVPVLQSTSPDVIKKRTEILKNSFKIEALGPGLENAFENTILSIISLYGNIKTIVEYTSESVI